MSQKFAAYETDPGPITAFYDSVDSPVPADVINVIPITYAQWQACLSGSGYSVANGALIASTPATREELLEQARVDQIAVLQTAYRLAFEQPVAYTTAAGYTDTFSADADSVNNLEAMLSAFEQDQSFPMNLWLNDAGSPVAPFTYADLQGLAKAIASQGTPDYQQLLSKIRAVMTANAIEDVQAVVW